MSAVNVTSMTGFARAEGRAETRAPFVWVWETRSVNGKNLDVRLRLPGGFEALEIPARQAAAEAFARGNLTLALHITPDVAARELNVDEAVLDALIALAAKKSGKGIEPARLDGLMAMAQSRAPQEVMDADALAARDA